MIPWHQWHIIRQCWHNIKQFSKRFGPLTFNPQLSPLTHVSVKPKQEKSLINPQMSIMDNDCVKSWKCRSQFGVVHKYLSTCTLTATIFDPINIKMELGPSMTPSHWRWKIDKKTLLPQWPTHEQNWPCYHNDWPLYQWLLVTLDNQWRIKR